MNQERHWSLSESLDPFTARAKTPSNELRTFIVTGSGKRIVNGEAIVEIAHSMAVCPNDRSPAAIASAQTAKVLVLRALRPLSASELNELVFAQFREDRRARSSQHLLPHPFSGDLLTGEKLVMAYDDVTTETVIGGPSRPFATFVGRLTMEALWRVWFCSRAQPSLGRALVSLISEEEPRH